MNTNLAVIETPQTLVKKKWTSVKLAPEGLKFCSRGNHCLPATLQFFRSSKSSIDGFGYWCRDCKNSSDRESHRRSKPPCPSCGKPKQKRTALCRACFEAPKEVSDADFLRTLNGCLEFQGARNPDGYGIKSGEYAHRVVWERAHGPIPDGLCVLHHCDNPPCGDLFHLFLGTRTENAIDKTLKGRAAQRLSIPEVREIRALTDLPRKAVAQRFKVSTVTIQKIWRRESWAWLQ